ncbi:Carboxylesterase 5A [Mactra antiquata]
MDKTVFVIFSFLLGASLVISQNAKVDIYIHGKDVEVIGEEQVIPWEGQSFTIHKYLGLPFAEPPVGDLRFRKSIPLEYMDSPFYAVDFGMPCVQFNFYKEAEFPQSEDCLYLNVYVPGRPADSTSGHAVAIWIHGGSYIEGSALQYDATFMSLYGNVIVVTINYRLGVYGFLTTEDEHAPGNYAFWDQHMAFRWVNEHIKQFGGDPDRVTIFGESAGAMSVSKQGIVPLNQGLFRRIIAQSGSPLHPPDYYAKGRARHVGELLNCDTTSSKPLTECLRQVTNYELMKALKDNKFAVMDLGYVLDYELFSFDHSKIPWLLEEKNLDGVEFYRSLDVMNGFNEYEGLTITDIFFSYLHEKDYLISRDEMRELMTSSLGWLAGTETDDSVIEMTLHEYTNWTDPEAKENVRLQFVKLFGDWIFGAPAIKTAQIHVHASYTGNFFYHFTANHSFGPLESPEWLPGANHADELPFMFGVEVYKPDLDPSTSWEIQLSRKMVTYWTNFMKNGNPNEGDPVSPYWPVYDMSTYSYLNLEENTTEESIGHHLYTKETNFWYNVFPHVNYAVQDHTYVEPCVSSAFINIPSSIVMMLSSILAFIIVL